MKEKKYSLDDAFKKGLELHQKGKIDDAEYVYKKILEVKPDHFLSLGNLGIIFSQSKKFNESIELFNRALKINPNDEHCYNNLGNALYEFSKIDRAIVAYNKAISLKPNFSDAFNNLGNAYGKKKNFNEAIKNYKLAISNNFEKNKDKPYYNLANIYNKIGKTNESIIFYKKALSINPNSIDSLINLSVVLNKNREFDKAIDCCDKVLEIDPFNTLAINNLGKYHQEIGNDVTSYNFYKKSVDLNPGDLKSMWLLMNFFPIVYKKTEQIDFFNKNFENNLLKIETLTEKEKFKDKDKILNALNSCTNFYLHYQGKNIINFQKRYGNIVQKLAQISYPEYQKKILPNVPSKFIKIGFISSFFCDHVVSKLFKNWILKLNKNRFKSYVYYTGTTNDDVTNDIKKKAHKFSTYENLDEAIISIINEKLDVLIFLDIGMDPKMQILASLKLARYQCCAFGVPVTTGFPNINYFLSSEAMEGDDANSHYSEKLIKIPGLGVDYDEPNKLHIKSFEIKKEKNNTYFLILQSNYKLLPQDDHVYFDILKKNSKSKFSFIGSKNKSVTNIFKSRIEILCREKNLHIDDYFNFYPQMPYNEYLELILKSDIILDSMNWSGLNTTIDAISLDKPVITMPDIFMRSRHSFGVLKLLKLDDLICESKTAYIDLAVKLSKDSGFQKEVIKKIKLNKKNIFNNYKTINYLESFFERIVKFK